VSRWGSDELLVPELGFSEAVIGMVVSLTLIGDAVISLIMTTTADRFGRRRMLVIGAGLMLFEGTLCAFTRSLPLLLIAAIFGVISPSGYEVGPFLAVEQAALSDAVPDNDRPAAPAPSRGEDTKELSVS
jgi:predicted MFS family arabinose efflux permease